MTVRVLVVDDDRAIRRVVVTGLRARGYDVIEAATARDGLGSAAVDAPDLIVLDLGLPDGDGVEVCRRVREFSSAAVIVLSVETSDRRKMRRSMPARTTSWSSRPRWASCSPDVSGHASHTRGGRGPGPTTG